LAAAGENFRRPSGFEAPPSQRAPRHRSFLMLPRENRLSAEFDFRRLKRNGQRYGTPFFNLFLLSNQKDPVRFGFVVSTHVSKLATRRNRLKRILRAQMEEFLPAIRSGTWGAFWVREPALGANSQVLRQAVEQTLKRAGVLL
jgi:ribonuclease P protein component